MSVYNPGIPNPTDLISNSQAPIKTNFGQLNTQFGVDHVPFNNGGANGTGFHKQVTLPAPLGSDPTGVLGGVIYTKLISAIPQLFFKNSASVVTQLTGLTQSVIANGTYTLPGGLIIKWGFQQSDPITGRIQYPVFFPTNTLSIVLQGAPTLNTPRLNGTPNAMGFTIDELAVFTFYIALGN